MLRYFILTALLAGGATSAATAQTTEVETHLAPSDTTNRVEGIYVAPGMTGAPKQQVTTDYDNQPLKRAKTRKSKSSTLTSDEPRRP
ncbi:hypothetical protein [Hymenobacter psychrophilus]|uniref:Uncharacterized protein n=1 Tax=Hymenobacter psychrophilus TaxID=651662 RepID=A0A1H3I3Y7_9BACT|nr:hypothetical protein [Hymenobacter psychrophilus]SDY21764.1 hypothetical protein SAMN04488069_106253 [Hymenobacter psychrophilus]